MDTEQPTGSGPSIESRMATVFGATEPAPEVAPEQQTAPVPEAAETSAEVPPEDDFEDFDVDGANYRLPKELKAKVSEWKDHALLREDYTRKTQVLAEAQRHVAATAEALQARQQFEESVSAERAELNRVKADIARYKDVDWASLDIDAHLKLRTQLEQLKDRSKELDSELNTKAGQFAQWSEGKKREIIQNGKKFLASAIKGWGPETVKSIASAAQSVGYTQAEIDSVLDVRFVQLAHKAAEYDKLMSGKQVALATAQKAPPVIKPGASQGQNAAVNQRFKETRQSLRKSGSVDDAARLIQMMSK
jgi:hypothetical protein